MPSAGLLRWQADRMARLGHMDAHCVALLASSPAPPPLAQESLQGYVMLVSGHFQGFCRDLYSECAQCCIDAVPAGLRFPVQIQFASGLKLDAGNPTVENIRKDFERFGLRLDLALAAPGNPARVSHLGRLNLWRNAVAHQNITSMPTGVPAALALGMIQDWRDACDGLATSLDTIMEAELMCILGGPPW